MKTTSTSTAKAAAITLALGLLGSVSSWAQTTESAGLLRDKAGKTLYTFDKDAAGESRCFEGCALAWPPFMAAEGAKASGKLTLIARKGGSAMQWAWEGKPLYYFAGDSKAGDANGDGSGGSWHVVKATAASDKRADNTGKAPANAYSTY